MIQEGLIKTIPAGAAKVAVYESRKAMGRAAAEDAAAALRKLLSNKDEVNVIFPCAVSQMDMFDTLFTLENIDWNRINGFAMIEYLGLPENHPALLSKFAEKYIFSRADFKSCSTMNSTNPDFEAECARYTALLAKNPIDFSFIGIGENGHLAYNEPHVADFNDKKLVRTVEIDAASKLQVVRDGTFKTTEEVPDIVMTVTIPPLLAPYMVATVPGKRKAGVLHDTVYSEISAACPATILRKYPMVIYTDVEGAERL